MLEHHTHLLAVLVDIDRRVGNINALKKIFPSVGCSSRFKERSSVDLPEPDGPIMTTTSPFWISRLISESAWSAPKLLPRCSTRTSAFVSVVTAAKPPFKPADKLSQNHDDDKVDYRDGNQRHERLVGDAPNPVAHIGQIRNRDIAGNRGFL